jgi:hypothetical protein
MTYALQYIFCFFCILLNMNTIRERSEMEEIAILLHSHH